MPPGVSVVVYVNLVGSLSIVSHFLIAYASCNRSVMLNITLSSAGSD